MQQQYNAFLIFFLVSITQPMVKGFDSFYLPGGSALKEGYFFRLWISDVNGGGLPLLDDFHLSGFLL